MNAIMLLDNDREADMGLAYITASAAGALDGDRVDHGDNVLKQITKKCHGAGIEPCILRVREQEGAGYHENFVFTFPLDRWHCLDALARQANVRRFDDGLGFGVRVQSCDDRKGGALRLAGYLCKEICTGRPLDVGGSRVAMNGAMARDMKLMGFAVPARKNVRRGLPRSNPDTLSERDVRKSAAQLHDDASSDQNDIRGELPRPINVGDGSGENVVEHGGLEIGGAGPMPAPSRKTFGKSAKTRTAPVESASPPSRHDGHDAPIEGARAARPYRGPVDLCRAPSRGFQRRKKMSGKPKTRINNRPKTEPTEAPWLRSPEEFAAAIAAAERQRGGVTLEFKVGKTRGVRIVKDEPETDR